MTVNSKGRIARWWSLWGKHMGTVPKSVWDELEEAIRDDERMVRDRKYLEAAEDWIREVKRLTTALAEAERSLIVEQGLRKSADDAANKAVDLRRAATARAETAEWKLGLYAGAALARVEAAERKATEAENLFAQRASAVRTEAAREALTRLAEKCTRGEMTTSVYCHFANDDDIIEFRDREYPAPTEREGARTDEPLSCEKAGYCVAPTACKPGVQCFTRPTPPQAAPEPLRVIAAFIAPQSSRWQGALVNVTEDGAWWQYAEMTEEWAQIAPPRRIVETGRASGRGE